ncbi:MAG: GDP-mannose 4,6-dehydratase [Planctomycetota bacterium]|nr:GDP-mannose 4,6-dehydratase [Planctomycetota bacterium]
MNVLITGGCGFLGSNVASRYLRDGARVTIIDKMYKSGSWENLRWLQGSCNQQRDLEFHEIDVASIDRMEDVFEKRGPFDYVCHLAGQVAMTTSLADPISDFRTNALGTLHLLECTRKWSPKALVAYSSTNKVYGDLRHLDYSQNDTRYVLAQFPDGIDETMPLDFASPYGCSKGSADQYVRDWFRNFGLDTVVFRHSSIYGGRQFATADQGWIGWFVKQALEQVSCRKQGSEVVPFTISGTGKQVRDVLHSEDLISLYQCAYEKRSRCAGEVFNIGGGMSNSLSLIELFDQLSILLERSEELSYSRLPRRQSDQDFFVADITKARELLEWTPRVSANEGLSQMIDWVGSL